jgi:cytochrome P450
MGLAEQYDHFAQDYVVDPFPLWERMRAREPVARSEKHGGYYIVSRYEDVREAASDPERFSSTQGTGIPPLPIVGMIPIDIDPPDQREYRRILNPAFNVETVEAQEDQVRSLAVKLIEPLVGLDQFEVTEALAVQIPPRTTLGFIGFPEEKWEVVIKAVDDITRLRGSDPQEVVQAGMALMGAVGELVAERTAKPGSDLIDMIIAGRFQLQTDTGEPHERPLEDHEIIRMIAIILFGAIDTTSLAITGSLHYLATHPAEQARLRAEGVSKTAVEELVRFSCPVQGLGRTVTRDTELGGCPLKQGDKVMLMWASGNRQESVFPEPDRMDFDRRPNPHLGFGHGPHKCVGLNFGKLMLRVTLEEFLARVGPFELADPEGIVYVGGETRGIKRLVLRPATEG